MPNARLELWNLWRCVFFDIIGIVFSKILHFSNDQPKVAFYVWQQPFAIMEALWLEIADLKIAPLLLIRISTIPNLLGHLSEILGILKDLDPAKVPDLKAGGWKKLLPLYAMHCPCAMLSSDPLIILILTSNSDLWLT